MSGVLPEGLTVLAGKPKVGKSWLALDFAIAVGLGSMVLGGQAVLGDALYLALEDTPRRLVRRAEKVLEGRPAPAGVDIWTRWPLDRGEGFGPIRDWIERSPNPQLVIIDTWGKVRPPTKGRRLYDDDYQSLSELHEIAGDTGTGLVVVHHFNKSEADDWMDSVSGTTGITGAADTVLGLSRERLQADARLWGTGRDMDEFDLALQFHSDSGRWAVAGEADLFELSAERRAIIDFLTAEGPATPKQVANALAHSDDAVRQLMRTMSEAGQLLWLNRGLYGLPEG